MKKALLAGILALGMAGSGFAADKAMDPAMKKMMELGAPGAGHKMLEPFLGNWTYTVSHRMNPGDKPQVSQGTAVNTFVYGGRFLKQDVKGDMGGMPFEGLGYTGYDNLRGQYQSTWMDSMSTTIMFAAGTYDAAKKTITTEGDFSCPMTGEKNRWMRSEWKVVNKDENTYTSYMKDAAGKDFKTMEIVYKRAK